MNKPQTQEWLDECNAMLTAIQDELAYQKSSYQPPVDLSSNALLDVAPSFFKIDMLNHIASKHPTLDFSMLLQIIEDNFIPEILEIIGTAVPKKSQKFQRRIN